MRPNGGQRAVELGRLGRQEVALALERGGEVEQPALVAADELRLELDPAVDDPASGHDVDLVQAQLDRRRVVAQESPAAELADRDDLDQRRIAAHLEDDRARIGGGPFARPGGPVGPALELLAPMRPRVAGGSSRRRLDRDERLARRHPQAGREAGASKGAVGRVEVAVLELRGSVSARRRPDRRARSRREPARRPRLSWDGTSARPRRDGVSRRSRRPPRRRRRAPSRTRNGARWSRARIE